MNSSRIWAIVVRHLYNFRHSLDRLADGFYWPSMDIILWGLTSQYIQKSGGAAGIDRIVLMLLSALVFWQVIWRGQYEITVNFLEELWSQNLVNLFSSPLRVGEWMVGVFLLGLIKMIFTVGFAMFLAWLLYAVNLLTFGWLLAPFFISLLMVGWWTGLIVAGLLVRFGMHIQTLAWSGVFLLAPFSAIYYPLSSLPAWARFIAHLLPSSYIFEGMRYALSTGKIPALDLEMSFILNIVYLAAAFFFFSVCFAKSREKGLSRLE